MGAKDLNSEGFITTTSAPQGDGDATSRRTFALVPPNIVILHGRDRVGGDRTMPQHPRHRAAGFQRRPASLTLVAVAALMPAAP
ncbi:MAG TPA: VWA domain-containing protein, partial [Brevundimonas diminuta]|nr:VWA domain-containing protein [Brevundimonas diminuta]